MVMYKSIDNGATWTSEGFSGRNTTSNFVDLSGINSFYGKIAYSSIAGAGSPPQAFAVYPNPVKDVLKARIISPVSSISEIIIYNMSGEKLSTKWIRLTSGVNTADLNGSLS